MTPDQIILRVFTQIKGWAEPALTTLNERIAALETDSTQETRAQELSDALDRACEVLAALDHVVKQQGETIVGLKKQLDDLPEPQQVDPAEIAQLVVKDHAAELKGEDGKDAEIDYATLAETVVKDHAAELKGEDGKDAEVDYATLAEIVVKDHAAELKGEDGKDAEVDEAALVKNVSDAVLEVVSKAVDQIPVPQDGKDALDIEILPRIEQDKSYPRGTYASHQGGLWKAFQKTDGMKGWECLVNGFAGSCEFEIKDNRTIMCRIAMSDGTEKMIEHKFPGLIYRGVYSDQNQYGAGDVASCGGSMWVAQKDAPGKPGVDHEGWQLAVKRGRDGKDKE